MRIKMLLIVLSFLFVSGTGIAQTTGADVILGKWENTEHTLRIEVYKTGKDIKAKIIWFRDRDKAAIPMDQRKDVHNPDVSLRDRKIIGMDLVDGLEYNSKENNWGKGVIYDATSGRKWSSSATMHGTDVLKVRGYWKFEWIGKTITFTRI